MGAARRIVGTHGPLGMYRGLAAPLATVAAFNAVLFSSWGATERMLSPDGGCAGVRDGCCWQQASSCCSCALLRCLALLPVPSGCPLTVGQAMLAGGLAGVPVSLLATPTELLKCRWGTVQAVATCWPHPSQPHHSSVPMQAAGARRRAAATGHGVQPGRHSCGTGAVQRASGCAAPRGAS